MPATRCVVLCLSVLAVTASPARAGTVTWESGFSNWGDSVYYDASSGETNDVTITLSPSTGPGTAIIIDRGNVVLPQPGSVETLQHCRFATGRAVCTNSARPFMGTGMHLGDGNDRGHIEAPSANQTGGFDGGAGNDVLIGGTENDGFTGGEGADDIHGGGGAMDDVDYWVYQDPGPGVHVTLDDVADDGHAGEGDNVHTDVEWVNGTFQGDDTLVGDAANNVLNGYGGNDTLLGGAGDDSLSGDVGNDVLDGGAGKDSLSGYTGDDVLRARDGAADARIDCGDGTDSLEDDALDAPQPGCETINTG
jgi:Ca2+-binding RTX toxin-like protein